MKILKFKGKMSLKNKLLIGLGVFARNSNFNNCTFVYTK